MGYPMSIVIRRLDNPLVDHLVNQIRCLHGNQVLHKDDFARGLLASMRRGETVGILMDTNMTPPQGGSSISSAPRLHRIWFGACRHEDRGPGSARFSALGRVNAAVCVALRRASHPASTEMWKRTRSPTPPCSPR